MELDIGALFLNQVYSNLILFRKKDLLQIADI